MDLDQFVLRLIVAALAGMSIGIERELREKAAGLRTLTLVSAGSALFVLTAAATIPEQSVRMMAGVTAGIGFLGAGAILRHEGEVFGLTTAASVWMSSALGITAAMGLFEMTAVASVLTVAVLFAVSLVPIGLIQRETRTYTLTWVADTPFTELTSSDVLDRKGVHARFWAMKHGDDSRVVTWLVDATRAVHAEIAEDLVRNERVSAFTLHN